MATTNGSLELAGAASKTHEGRSKASTFQLINFVENAQSATSSVQVAEVVKQAIESPSIFVFGELLDVDNVKALRGTAEEPYLTLLNLFAFGTFSEYQQQKLEQSGSLPDLSPSMSTKLKQLSIVSLARSRRNIPYEELQQELEINNIRQLEDLIIELIYANVIKGTIDQQNRRLEVDQTIGRDVRIEDFDTITSVLGDWCNNCDSILTNLEQQMSAANHFKDDAKVAKALFESKVAAVKKNSKNVNENEDIVMSELSFGREERVEKMKRNASSKVGKSFIHKNHLTKNWRKDN
ncbi:PREDICTED: COP9 signalosome complex subunit 7b-like [Rhagoletis zephyria]|uniref:COP9 signalosome complex subunit 7b-like n=1 Tax=Rhagoletis zephyria TaxID=28612 RepID=UPI0008113F3E|nr:PREDICTED: COP9 signalosome complex subunit 7b-like [Rhagoletis zephyria]